MDNHSAALLNRLDIKLMPWQEYLVENSFRRPMMVALVPRQRFHFFPSPNIELKELSK